MNSPLLPFSGEVHYIFSFESNFLFLKIKFDFILREERISKCPYVVLLCSEFNCWYKSTRCVSEEIRWWNVIGISIKDKEERIQFINFALILKCTANVCFINRKILNWFAYRAVEFKEIKDDFIVFNWSDYIWCSCIKQGTTMNFESIIEWQFFLLCFIVQYYMSVLTYPSTVVFIF